MDTIRILVADDHPICSAMVSLAMRDRLPEAEISEVISIQQVLEHLDSQSIDLLVLDLSLSDCSGLKGLALVRAARPDMPVVIFSSSNDQRLLHHAMVLGARKILSKELSREEIGSELSATLVESDGSSTEIDGRTVTQLPNGPLRVVPLLLEGNSNRAIAQTLGLSEITVKKHLSAVFRGLGVNKRSQAILELQPA